MDDLLVLVLTGLLSVLTWGLVVLSDRLPDARNVDSVYVRRQRTSGLRRLLGARDLADDLVHRATGTGIHVAAGD